MGTGVSSSRTISRLLVLAVAGALAGAALVALAGCSSTPPPPAAPVPADTRPASGASPVAAVTPATLAGNWLLSVKSGSRTIEGSLHFSVESGVLAGTWTSADGREFELSKIEIDGDSVSWESDGPTGRTHATGKIDGTSMKGTMKRAAKSRGSSSSGGSSDSGDSAPPTDSNGEGGSSGGSTHGGGRGRGSGGHGGRGRSGSSSSGVTWTAYKSTAPVEVLGPVEVPGPGERPGPVETPGPGPTPTPMATRPV
jgi:hypothetical protein